MSEPMTPEREAALRHRAANMRCEPENVNLNTLICKLCKRSWWFAAESKYDPCQVKLRHAPLDLQDAFKEIDRLRESEVALKQYKQGVDGIIHHLIESDSSLDHKWAGDKHGWGFAFEWIKWIVGRLRAEQRLPPGMTAERLGNLALAIELFCDGSDKVVSEIREWAAWLRKHLCKCPKYCAYHWGENHKKGLTCTCSVESDAPGTTHSGECYWNDPR